MWTELGWAIGKETFERLEGCFCETPNRRRSKSLIKEQKPERHQTKGLMS